MMRLDDHARPAMYQDLKNCAEGLYGEAAKLELYVSDGGKIHPEDNVGKQSNAALKRLLKRALMEALMIDQNTKPARYLALAAVLRQAADEAEALAGPVARKKK